MTGLVREGAYVAMSFLVPKRLGIAVFYSFLVQWLRENHTTRFYLRTYHFRISVQL